MMVRWMPVHVDGAADDSRIGLKPRAPQVITDYDFGRGTISPVVVHSERASQYRLYAEQVEVVAGHNPRPIPLRPGITASEINGEHLMRC